MVDSSERARDIAKTYERDEDITTLINCPQCNSLIDIEYYVTCGVCNLDLSEMKPVEVPIMIEESAHISSDCLSSIRAMVKVMLPNHTISILEDGAVELYTWDPNNSNNLLTIRRWTSSDILLEENINAPTQ